MVKTKTKLLPALAAALSISLFFGSHVAAFGGGQPDPEEKENPASVMVKPDTPPDGQRYDEWKGFQYTDQTEFDVKTYGYSKFSRFVENLPNFRIRNNTVMLSDKAEK